METQGPAPLDAAARRDGRRHFRTFFTFNAISVAVHMNSILILYAIKNGLSDSALAALASFSYLTMPFLLLGKPIVARHGLARSWSTMWMLRYVSIAIILAAPFVPTLALRTATILVGAFGFSMFRSAGMINNQPLIGEVATSDERGRFVSGNHVRFNISYAFSLAAVTIILFFFESVVTFQLLIAIGVAVGILSARILGRIPESGESRAAAAVPFRKSVRTILSRNSPRKLLWAYSAGFVALQLVVPFALVAAKNGYGVSDWQAAVYVIASVLGSLVSAYVNQEISDRVGPRPLLIVYTTMIGAIALFWSFAPTLYVPAVVALVFAVMGFAKTGMIVTTRLYALSIARDGELFPLSMLTESISGFAAGLAGTIFAGTLLHLFGQTLAAMAIYRAYFRLVIPVIALALWVIVRMERLDEWKTVHVLGLITSPRAIHAIFRLNRTLQQDEAFPDSPRAALRMAKNSNKADNS